MKHELKVIQTADPKEMTTEYNQAVKDGWKGAAIQHYVVGDQLIHCATLIKYDDKDLPKGFMDSFDSGDFGSGSFGGGMAH